MALVSDPAKVINSDPDIAPEILVDELLGFSPPLLLDDIIDIANDAIGKVVDAMEQQMNRWAEDRANKTQDDDWDSAQEIEQGIVAFSTLLQFHTDVAFDFFEDWSLRNIFSIPADLHVVTPHHAGLSLDVPPECEGELLAEIEDLRRRIENQRRLKRLTRKAKILVSARAASAQRRLACAKAVGLPNLNALRKLPDELLTLYQVASSLPDFDASQVRLPAPEPGKQPWVSGKTGYTTWAVTQLVAQARKLAKESKRSDEQLEAGAPSSAHSREQGTLSAVDAGVDDLSSALKFI